jgi:Tol biopolymer transport system component
MPMRIRLLPLTALLLAAFALAGCGLLDEPGWVVYATGEEGSRDIAVVNPATGEQRIIIAHTADDFAPVWSANQQWVAFLSDRDGNVELYLATADGLTVMRATNTGVDESSPTWSPDGKRVAYVSPTESGEPRVQWLRLADLIPQRLAPGSFGEQDPAWSPTGEWIAFAGLQEDGSSRGLLLRNPDGVNQLQVSESSDSQPVWSPDGRRLAYVSTRDGNEEIYVVRVGPAGPEGQAQRLTDDPARDFSPQWSPDGKQVLFLSDRNGNLDLFTVSDQGENTKALTRNGVNELSARYGRDGRIVFVSVPDARPALFLVSKDGAQSQLPAGSQPASQPDW